MIIRHLILLAALSPFAAFGAEKITNFQSATYTEVVKDVSTVSGTSGKAERAASGKSFSKEDLVKSGRGSRAQLTAPDGTVIRVGPNAVFSLDKTSRAIKLESGSVLFYTPPGNGGGRIITDSVTCAVTGTTIVVTMDPVSGFKLQVLEGTAVVTSKSGATLSVDSGQSVSVPVNYTGPLVSKTFTASEVTSSILVNGFDMPLASASKIVEALGSLPKATPAQIAAGTDTGITGGGSGIPSSNPTNGGQTNVANNDGTPTPAVTGQPVIPNVAQTSGTLNPTNPSQTISPNGEGQTN